MTSALSIWRAACSRADATPLAPSTSTLSLFDAVMRDNHAVRGTIGDRQCCGFLESDFVRHADQLMLSDEAFLG
jgi:hypothetical protein